MSEPRNIVLQVNPRELATILAALRYHQAENLQGGSEIADASIRDIATDGGTLRPLSTGEIDDLCAKLNSAGEDEKAMVKRWILYDFDAETLVGGLYRRYDEAIFDARQLDNIQIITIPWHEEAQESAQIEVLVSLAADASPQLVEQLEATLGQKAVSSTPLAGSLDVLFVCADAAAAESLAKRAEGLDFVVAVAT